MGAERWDEQVGSVADEAARLLESLRRTAADAADPPDGGGPKVHEDDDGSRPGAEEADARPGCEDPFCQWCPLCRTSAVVRSLSPETLARLADLAGVAAAVLADLAAARGRTSTPDPAEAPAEPARPRTRPIPVDDAAPQED
ncbi:hypothetical protein ACK8HX_03085 [Oryzobacter sp. R7]|uniref:hypothetical protein n=1 Tax=Oryzobacter faecalis TaxID=3388656 RepID=UPI00398CC0DA